MFGLISPNGTGKTTTIIGEKLSGAIKNRLGYLPEERGLYKKLRVLESIVYLASLKGMDKDSAREKAGELFKHTGLLDSKKKKIEELSKGMAQIIQLNVTIIHNP